MVEMLNFSRTEYHNQKVMNMSRTRLLLVLTLAFVFVARACGARHDEDLKSEIENKKNSQGQEKFFEIQL